jgi:hypothetical protein
MLNRVGTLRYASLCPPSLSPLLPQETECGGTRRQPYRGRQQRQEKDMHFRITGLPAEDFSHLFQLSDEELASA